LKLNVKKDTTEVVSFFTYLIPEAGLEPARLAASHFECDVSAIPPLGHNNYSFIKLEAATGIEPVIRVLQTHALPLGYAAVE
jgi:hypothetical protein